MKKILLLGLGALVIGAMPALAFHDDGVAHCDGCHTMHNSVDGVAVAYGPDGSTLLEVGTGNDFLLKYASATDVCLSCHGDGNEGRDVWDWGNTDCAATPEERGAGDFDCQGAANISDSTRGGPVPGYKSGHTLISALAGQTDADGTLTVAPGGTYPSNQLRCTSCHDPHGTGNFRLLYGEGQITPLVGEWDTTLEAIGITLSTSRGGPEANDNHNVYLSGYSDWCSECHEAMHDANENIHPSGELIGAEERGIYNGYIGSVDCIGGPCPSAGPGADETADAYLAQVPFEDPTRTLISDTRGPGAQSRVACVTCHRAHGTSAQDNGRWDFRVTALEEDGLNGYALPNPYGAGQRSLCNKCHAKDAYDAPWS